MRALLLMNWRDRQTLEMALWAMITILGLVVVPLGMLFSSVPSLEPQQVGMVSLFLLVLSWSCLSFWRSIKRGLFNQRRRFIISAAINITLIVGTGFTLIMMC